MLTILVASLYRVVRSFLNLQVVYGIKFSSLLGYIRTKLIDE